MIRLIACVLATAVFVPLSAHAQHVVPRNSPDSLALNIAMYVTALRNGIGTAHAANSPLVACVRGETGDPPANVIAALTDSTPVLVLGASRCRHYRSPDGRQMNAWIADTVTGRRGVQISVEGLSFESDGTFNFQTRYWQHMLSSGHWGCFGERKSGVWIVRKCQLLSIS